MNSFKGITILFLVLFSITTLVESCQFECPAGHRAVARAEHQPSSNGCGTAGFRIGTEFDFEDCCHEHDLCYDQCGRGKAHHKQRCDEAFGTCMVRYCTDHAGQRVQECNSAAQLFKMGTVGFGCSAYLSSQQNACECKLN